MPRLTYVRKHADAGPLLVVTITAGTFLALIRSSNPLQDRLAARLSDLAP
jgi:hypothetical protein